MPNKQSSALPNRCRRWTARSPGLVEMAITGLPDSIVPINRADLGHRPANQVFGAGRFAFAFETRDDDVLRTLYFVR